MSEIYLIVCVIGAIVMMGVKGSAFGAFNPTTPVTANILWQIFGIFSLITLVWSGVKQTRFTWLFKAANSLMIVILAALIFFGLRQEGLSDQVEEEPIDFVGNFTICAFLVLTLTSHYDFKLTLLIGTPAITLALYAK